MYSTQCSELMKMFVSGATNTRFFGHGSALSKGIRWLRQWLPIHSIQQFRIQIWKREIEKKKWFEMNQKAFFFSIVQVSVHRWKRNSYSSYELMDKWWGWWWSHQMNEWNRNIENWVMKTLAENSCYEFGRNRDSWMFTFRCFVSK